jgi:hypothetical protein
MNPPSPLKRVNLEFIIGVVNNVVNSVKFKTLAPKKPTDFTRNRKMPLIPLVYFLLNLVRETSKVGLNRFIDFFPLDIKNITQQAFSKARQKLSWIALRYLMDEVTKSAYSGAYMTWHGFRMLAIDGVKIQLPSDPILRQIFGTFGRNNKAATAQGSALFDVLNNIIVDASIYPISIGERLMAMCHMDFLKNNVSTGIKNLVLFDRGYASFELIEYCVACGVTYVMRLKSKFNSRIDLLPLGCHYFTLRQGGKECFFRVIKFKLDTGEIETLITNLFDENLGTEDFKDLYNKRWRIEVKYNQLKHSLEIENFSGLTEEAIFQDFYVTILLNNILTIATWEAQDIVDENAKDKERKYEYKVNFNQAIGTFKNNFIAALIESNPVKRAAKIETIIKRMAEAVIPIRPGRSIPRNPCPREANFYHNIKSNC